VERKEASAEQREYTLNCQRERWANSDYLRAQRRRFILGAIFTIPLVLLFSGFLISNVVSPSTGLHTFKGQGLQKITREHLENGTFYPGTVELNWLAEGEIALRLLPLFPQLTRGTTLSQLEMEYTVNELRLDRFCSSTLTRMKLEFWSTETRFEM